MASTAKLHILPSLALKLQSYNKNRSGAAPAQANPAGQSRNPGRHPPGASRPPQGREQQRGPGGGSCLLRGAPPGAGAVRGWAAGPPGEGRDGARGTRRRFLPPFLCHPRSPEREELLGAGRGWAGVPAGTTAMSPAPPGARHSPAGTLRDAPPRDPPSLGVAPWGRCRSWRREAQRCSTAPPRPGGRGRGKGYPRNEARVARSPPARGAPQSQRCAPAAQGEGTQPGVPCGEPWEGQGLLSPLHGGSGDLPGWIFDNGRESWIP